MATMKLTIKFFGSNEQVLYVDPKQTLREVVSKSPKHIDAANVIFGILTTENKIKFLSFDDSIRNAETLIAYQKKTTLVDILQSFKNENANFGDCNMRICNQNGDMVCPVHHNSPQTLSELISGAEIGVHLAIVQTPHKGNRLGPNHNINFGTTNTCSSNNSSQPSIAKRFSSKETELKTDDTFGTLIPLEIKSNEAHTAITVEMGKGEQTSEVHPRSTFKKSIEKFQKLPSEKWSIRMLSPGGHMSTVDGKQDDNDDDDDESTIYEELMSEREDEWMGEEVMEFMNDEQTESEDDDDKMTINEEEEDDLMDNEEKGDEDQDLLLVTEETKEDKQEDERKLMTVEQAFTLQNGGCKFFLDTWNEEETSDIINHLQRQNFSRKRTDVTRAMKTLKEAKLHKKDTKAEREKVKKTLDALRTRKDFKKMSKMEMEDQMKQGVDDPGFRLKCATEHILCNLVPRLVVNESKVTLWIEGNKHDMNIQDNTTLEEIVKLHDKVNMDSYCINIVQVKDDNNEALPEESKNWHPRHLLGLQKQGYKFFFETEDKPPSMTISEQPNGMTLTLRMDKENHCIVVNDQTTLQDVMNRHDRESGMCRCTGFTKMSTMKEEDERNGNQTQIEPNQHPKKLLKPGTSDVTLYLQTEIIPRDKRPTLTITKKLKRIQLVLRMDDGKQHRIPFNNETTLQDVANYFDKNNDAKRCTGFTDEGMNDFLITNDDPHHIDMNTRPQHCLPNVKCYSLKIFLLSEPTTNHET